MSALKKGAYHIMCQSPTGSGKTFIFSNIIARSAAKGKKVLVLSDRTELLAQTSMSLKEFGLQPFVIQAGCKFVNENFQVYNAMSQTFKNRIKTEYWQKFLSTIDLIIIDEAHKQEFNYLFESGLIDKTYLIGFSATPDRTGKMRQLALDYDVMVEGPSVKELIDLDDLVPDHYFGFTPPDMSGVGYDAMRGDYNTAQMFGKFNTPELRSGVVKNYLKHIPNTKTMIFCVNTMHAINTTLDFQKKGIDARFIVSNRNKPNRDKVKNDADLARYNDLLKLYDYYNENYEKYSGERKTLLNAHKRGDFPALINIDIFTTGYDDKSLESIIVDRATQRRTLWYQMIGRGSRTFEGKEHFNILDFGGNASRLGYYDEKQNWSLWHEVKKTKGLPKLKICGENSEGQPKKSASHIKVGCKRPILASLTICPFCGFQYISKQSKAKEVELQLMSSGKKFPSIEEMGVAELLEFRAIKKHSQAWLWRQLYYKGGEAMIRKVGKSEGWKQSTIERAIKLTIRK